MCTEDSLVSAAGTTSTTEESATEESTTEESTTEESSTEESTTEEQGYDLDILNLEF